MTKPRFQDKDLFFFFFWSSLLYLWAKTEIRTIGFRCAPPCENRAPRGPKRRQLAQIHGAWFVCNLCLSGRNSTAVSVSRSRVQ